MFKKHLFIENTLPPYPTTPPLLFKLFLQQQAAKTTAEAPKAVKGPNKPVDVQSKSK